MSTKIEQSNGVGHSFMDWATRIYPTHLVVDNSTNYLRVLRVRMLRVVRRIDDELKRRERGQVGTGQIKTNLPEEHFHG